MAKSILRKSYFHVHVTYQDDGYTNNLNADNFSVAADDHTVLFSMDFSINQRTRSKSSNSYLDVLELVQNASRVKFLQIEKCDWLKGLFVALRDHPAADLKIEMTFSGNISHTYRYKPESKNGSIWFYLENS